MDALREASRDRAIRRQQLEGEINVLHEQILAGEQNDSHYRSRLSTIQEDTKKKTADKEALDEQKADLQSGLKETSQKLKEEQDKLFQQQCAIASLEEAKKNTQLAEKNTKIAEENNEICKSALSKSIIDNRLSFISIVIAIVSLIFAICK